MRTPVRSTLPGICLPLLVGLLVSLACSLPFSGRPAPTQAAVTVTTIEAVPLPTEEPPTAEPAPTETEVPTPTPTQPVGNMVDFQGVKFYYAPTLAGGVNASVVPASQGIEEGPFPAVHPEYLMFEFQDYTLGERFHAPVIYIYPVEAYKAMSPEVGAGIENLQVYLENKPEEAEHIPFLPVWNAAQMFHSNVKFIDFQNGHGVRFISQYSQAVMPINSYETFYTFQGVTDDGKYYVAAVLPVSHSNLKADASFSNEEWETLEQNFEKYMDETIAMLNSQADESFGPGLQVFDTMIGTIKIEK